MSKNISIHSCGPGQENPLQYCVSVSSPVQSVPPLAACVLIDLVRDCSPTPHVLEQLLHSPKGCHSQLTKDVSNWIPQHEGIYKKNQKDNIILLNAFYLKVYIQKLIPDRQAVRLTP